MTRVTGYLAAEQRLLEARGQARVDLAVEAYTYAHFRLVAGIVLAALGVEGVLAHAASAALTARSGWSSAIDQRVGWRS
jgi:low temperature requirement protein LtrA